MAQRPFIGPVDITQEYGNPDPTARRGYHTGVDYGMNTGSPIIAPESGRVESGDGRAPSDGRGFYVIVYGDSGTAHCLYHLSQIGVAGGRVSEGEQVGLSGATGRATGPHLHWETRRAPFDGYSDYAPATWLFGNKQTPAPAPAPSSSQIVYLPAVPQWRLYNEGGPYTIGTEKALLAPAKFGGLSYQVLGTPVPNVVVIQTQMFGRGAIYVGPGTGAVIK
jgi:hypothetical protein